MTTHSSKSFHVCRAFRSLVFFAEDYLLSIREVGRAALKAQTRVRTMWVRVVIHHSQALWFQAGGHSCFLTSAARVVVLTSSWFLQGFTEVLSNRTEHSAPTPRDLVNVSQNNQCQRAFWMPCGGWQVQVSLCRECRCRLRAAIGSSEGEDSHFEGLSLRPVQELVTPALSFL